MKNKKTPYWWGVIERAKERKREGMKAFTSSQRTKARWSWTDCACGRQDPRIPRDSDGMPRDRTLVALGLDFGKAVDNQLPSKAARLLRSIERRSFRLITEMGL
jgi:hypothetical protein